MCSEIPLFQRFIKICEYYFQLILEDNVIDYKLRVNASGRSGPSSTPIKKQHFKNRFKSQRVVVRERKYELTGILDYD